MPTPAIPAALLAFIAVCASAAPAIAQAAANDSPITAGFWSFPAQKTDAAADILAACRKQFEIHFADGHFVGLRTYKREVGSVGREVDVVGRCTFNRDKQVDACELKHIHADGSILGGTTENKYALDGQKTLSMTVTPKMITDSPVDNAPYKVFPVRCPDEALWKLLNETALPK